MKIPFRLSAQAFTLALSAALFAAMAAPQAGFAQAPGAPPQAANGPPPGPMRIAPDPRVEERTYRFEPTDEDLAYVLFVSSKVDPATPAPLIVALHGLGGDGHFIVRDRLVDLAEDGGYVVVGPLGYNVSGWYGSPVIVMGGGEVDPPNLAELSEQDVMTVLDMTLAEFNIDPNRIYIMGHSMGGAGAIFLAEKHADLWAGAAAIAPAAFMMQSTQRDILGSIHEAGLPLLITQGGDDTVVPTENTRTWGAAMEDIGMSPGYLELEGRGHGGDIIGDSMPEIFVLFGQSVRGR